MATVLDCDIYNGWAIYKSATGRFCVLLSAFLTTQKETNLMLAILDQAVHNLPDLGTHSRMGLVISTSLHASWARVLPGAHHLHITLGAPQLPEGVMSHLSGWGPGDSIATRLVLVDGVDGAGAKGRVVYEV